MLLTIVMTLVLHCSDRGVTVGAVRCQAGHFISQGPARVTCLFHTNVFQTKHNFVVEMYRSRSTQSVPEIPLLCSWLVPEKPDCVIKEGYSFDYHITDRLTLNIPNVTQAFAGLYVCRLVPPDGMPAPQCNLTVQDARREDETELPTSPTTIVTDTEPESQRRECPGVDTAVVFVLVQGYVLLLFASILIHIGIHRSYTTGRLKMFLPVAGPSHCGTDKTSDLTAAVSSTVRTTIRNSLLPASLLPSVLTVKAEEGGMLVSGTTLKIHLMPPHCRR